MTFTAVGFISIYRINWSSGQNDNIFIDLFNKVWVGNIDDDIQKLLKTKFIIYESGENLIKRWLAHMHRMNLLWKVMKLF